jgi:cyclohexanecarboxylate-CoA ligase
MRDIRPEQARLAAHVEAGHWLRAGEPSGCPHILRTLAKKHPDKVLTVDRLGSRTYREIEDKVARAAAALARMGIVQGDAVLVQLPNWHEALVVHLAAESLGAATIAIPHIYRAREVRHIASLTEAKIAIIPWFGAFDFVGMYRELRPELPALRRIIVIGSDGVVSLEGAEAAAGSPLDGERLSDALLAAPATDPDRVTQVGFTSGSTGAPKGAIHTSNTLLAEHRAWTKAFGLGSDDVILVLATVGHQIGFTMMRAALMIGATVAFLDKWDASRALELVESAGVTFTFTTPAFLFDVLKTPAAAPGRLPTLRTWVLAGQVVTSALRDEATAKLPHVRFAPLFGMTEMGCVIMCDKDAPDAKLSQTGRSQLGVEIDVIDRDEQTVPPDTDGELVVRGPSLLLGYLKQPDATAASFTKKGYFKTGDQVRRDADGFVMITGRIKDLIKRGGESVSPEEVEEVLARHPAIVEASVVGIPDDRLGERVCAFVIPRPGEKLVTLQDVVAFLRHTDLTKQKWPERVEIVDVLPRTSIGKVDKASLRAKLATASSS